MEDNKESFGKVFLREFISFLKYFAIAFIAAFIISRYIIINAVVPTGSMTNTIMEHDRLIGFRLSYVFSEPERGDIIIFKYPDNEKENFVKRVIGIPGDVIEISDGHVTVLSTIGLNCRCLNVGLLLDRGSIPLISTMNENSDLKCRSFFIGYRIM